MEGQLLNLWGCPTWQGSFLAHLFGSGADVPGSCSAVLARRELVVAAGAFDETLRGAEDPDLWIRLAAISEYACLAEPMAVILRRPGSVSRNLEAMRESTLRMMSSKNRHLLPPLQGDTGVHASPGFTATTRSGATAADDASPRCWTWRTSCACANHARSHGPGPAEGHVARAQLVIAASRREGRSHRS